MRVLLSTIGSRGDVQPLVALALQLRELGHHVRLLVPPDFQDWIAGLGMFVMPIGPELRTVSAAGPVPEMTAERRRQLAESSVAAQFETVAAAAEACDVIVGASALQIAARSVAERMDIGYVFVAYCPIVLPSPHHAPPPLPPLPGEEPLPPDAGHRERWERDTARFNGLFGPVLNSFRASLALTPVDDVRSHVFTDHPWLAADPVLAPWPGGDGLEVFQSGAWVVHDERALPRAVEAFLDAGTPPIYFGFGSMRAAADATALVASARALGRRAILSRGWADLSVTDHANDVLVVDEVNQQKLFARVAATVHHGGAGTTTVAALAGTPQVIVPQLYDQHYWAGRVESLGVGAAHAPGTPTAESLAAALARALQPEVAARARDLASRMTRDGARAAAERLAGGAGASRSPRP